VTTTHGVSPLDRWTKPHVLIVSTALDLSTDSVVRALNVRGVRVTRWNTEDFPFESELSVYLSSPSGASAHGTSAHLIRHGGERVDLSDVSAVWYRRARMPEAPAGMDPGIYDFCMRESRAALYGSLLAVLPDDARWMSRPGNIWAAEHKLLQLRVASEAGLLIPETVVTNTVREARAAFKRFGGHMIAKPVRTGYIEVGGAPHAIFTSEVGQSDLKDMRGAGLSPVIYQQHLKKRFDLRVTAVGEDLFVAEIHSQENEAARVDWRKTDDPHLPHRRGSLPAATTSAIRALMRRLGLTFGALDFVMTADGDLVFLEVNPNGQWLWLDDQLDFGISEAVAAWLALPSVRSPQIA
jgi:glutathione synthase/RimK-type ligase-like ATP-grasp enzyme